MRTYTYSTDHIDNFPSNISFRLTTHWYQELQWHPLVHTVQPKRRGELRPGVPNGGRRRDRRLERRFREARTGIPATGGIVEQTIDTAAPTSNEHDETTQSPKSSFSTRHGTIHRHGYQPHLHLIAKCGWYHTPSPGVGTTASDASEAASIDLGDNNATNCMDMSGQPQ